jgi:hypothetical protein
MEKAVFNSGSKYPQMKAVIRFNLLEGFQPGKGCWPIKDTKTSVLALKLMAQDNSPFRGLSPWAPQGSTGCP